MATVYLMNLQERVELARNQLDLVVLRLQSVKAQGVRTEVARTVDLATRQLEQIRELIGC
jgi:hypothetical protein